MSVEMKIIVNSQIINHNSRNEVINLMPIYILTKESSK